VHPVGDQNGVELSAFGVPVFAGQFGAFVPIAAEATAGGYQVAWGNAAGQFTVLNADSAGVFQSHAFFVVSGGSYALQSIEPTFQQDLNGDGTVGLVTTAVEAQGATTLAQVADTYFLYAGSGTTGPQLKYGGSAVTVGEFGGWTPIGAEAVSGGYEVVWQAGGHYTVWTVDSAGDTVGGSGFLSGGNYALQSLEASFQQDLNSDGTVGLVTTPIESHGVTTLTQVADTYFLYAGSGTTGPQLKFGGPGVTVGEFGGWTPVGAEAVSGGYKVVWQAGGLYTIWNLDSGGNYTSSATGFITGRSLDLLVFETTFQQDLNNNGTVDSVTTIEASGSTTLVQAGSSYYLAATGTLSGPQLYFGGAPVAAGMFAGWTPIGADLQASGYRVAWKLTGVDSYIIWNVDGNGAYATEMAAVSGSSTTLRAVERAMSQDLNGDNQIASATTIESVGATRVVQVLDTYFLNTSNGFWGPQISSGNTAVTTTAAGGFTPIGGEVAGNAYRVAWKAGSDQYIIWNTDMWGRFSSGTGVLSGSSTTLQSFEPLFGQDLNGDGTIGLDRFNITVRYSGDSAYQSYFDAAARRWEQVITAGLPNEVDPTYGSIDDLLIDASVVSIDGRNGILGQAGPNSYHRIGRALPIHGIMQFDSADIVSMVSQGTFGDVVLHEMGHVLGIGTLWSAFGLKPTFTTYGGAGAVAAFQQLSGNPGAGTVPLESTGGSGTVGVHWSESVFANELMTGFISGRPNPLSILTVGSLQDLGYAVNYAAADAYTMPGHLESASAVDGGELSSLVEASADPAPAWFGSVDGLSSDFVLPLPPHEHEDDEYMPRWLGRRA
jgi:hypothetical protein